MLFMCYVLDPNGDVAKTQVVGLVAGLLTTLLIFSAIIIAAFIICRRRSQRKRLAMTKMAQCNEMGMYSDDPPDVNYDDMKLELCLHRGRFGDVSYSCIRSLSWPEKYSMMLEYFAADWSTLQLMF